MFAHVLVELGAKTIDKTFTYIIPPDLEEKVKVGVRVKVSFGKKIVEGFVLKITDNDKSEYKLKDVIDVIDEEPVLNDELLELGKYISNKTLCYLIEAYQSMLPLALKAKEGTKINIREEKYIELNIGDNVLNDLKLNSKGKEIVNYLQEHKIVKKSELAKISLSSIKTLLNKNIIKESKKEIYRLADNNENVYEELKLTADQQYVINEIKKEFNNPSAVLLHGVTGSGKTEVYMELVSFIIKQKQQAIILVPEISLTPQMVNRFKSRFGNDVAILHSALSNGEKYDEWRRINRNEVSIVIGARSAIFAPLTNLGLIVIDEEHVTTYKQENHPRYNAIDIAIWRSQYYKCPLVLGSATPSLESYARAQKGVYKLWSLPNRINNKALPKVEIIDMKKEMKKNNKYFSDTLIQAIKTHLARGEQIIILLNRRGYSSLITCRNCGYTDKCPNCDISLTYHKTSNNMRCHYCGYGSKKLTICPSCQSEDINEFGIGTQKVEEQLKKIFKDAKVIRMDMDTTTTKGSHAKIIDAFRKEQYNILLGTQMIAKGLDFPKVTLVGVLNGDTSLNIPDFRSAERTFQLLSQVAGRAGRNDLEGEVIIQTFNPDHYSIECAKNHDYLSFYNYEMAIRKTLKYTPYYYMSVVRILSKDYETGITESKKIGDFLRHRLSNDIVLGPSTSNLYKLNNIYRFQCIIKYKKIDQVTTILMELIDHYRNDKKISIEIDIDPVRI